MRIAGIQLDAGHRVWADAGDLLVSPLDHVIVRLGESEFPGWVFASPDQLLNAPVTPDATLLSSESPTSAHTPCLEIPGADMPPLGSMVPTDRGLARITAINPVRKSMILSYPDGTSEEVPTSSKSTAALPRQKL